MKTEASKRTAFLEIKKIKIKVNPIGYGFDSATVSKVRHLFEQSLGSA